MRIFLMGIIVISTLAACSEEQEPQAQAPDIEAGRAMAAEQCSGCHGLDGRGQESDIPDLAAQPADYLADALHAYQDGRRHHAALRDLASDMSEANIRNIAAYYASLPPVEAVSDLEPQPPGGSSYHDGAAIAAICTDCHGERGYSQTPGVPSLAGQQPAYLIVSTLEYVTGNRGHAEKEKMLQGLQQIDIEKMSLYFASQSPPVREAPPFGDPARGEPLSAACGECHGARGVSHEPLVPSLAGQEPTYLVDAITAYRDEERHHEVMMTDSSDAEIEDIAAFYAVQGGEAAADDSLAVQELAAKCDRCHAPTTGTFSMAVPTLYGQNREYLVKAMKAYRDDARGSAMMHKMSAAYNDQMIEGIANYYAIHSGN
jgi:cytochrome c553